ncbi:MAG: PAS domain-containing protein, partial [Bacteroidota bacterium]
MKNALQSPLLLKTDPRLVFILDTKGLVMDLNENASRLFQISKGGKMTDIVLDEDQTLVNSLIESVFQETNHVSSLVRFVSKDDDVCYLQVDFYLDEGNCLLTALDQTPVQIENDTLQIASSSLKVG